MPGQERIYAHTTRPGAKMPPLRHRPSLRPAHRVFPPAQLSQDARAWAVQGPPWGRAGSPFSPGMGEPLATLVHRPLCFLTRPAPNTNQESATLPEPSPKRVLLGLPRLSRSTPAAVTTPLRLRFTKNGSHGSQFQRLGSPRSRQIRGSAGACSLLDAWCLLPSRCVLAWRRGQGSPPPPPKPLL